MPFVMTVWPSLTIAALGGVTFAIHPSGNGVFVGLPSWSNGVSHRSSGCGAPWAGSAPPLTCGSDGS